MHSIMSNNIWILSDLPPGCKSIGCRWIFRKKLKSDGTLDKYKARLVAKGFNQLKDNDYFDTFAPIARITFYLTLDCFSRNSQSSYTSNVCEDCISEWRSR